MNLKTQVDDDLTSVGTDNEVFEQETNMITVNGQKFIEMELKTLIV